MNDFIKIEQEPSIVAAIRDAEARTSGEIRVYITDRWVFRIESHARKVFRKLGLENTKRRNAALICVFSRRKRFTILGDEGINQFVEETYWESLAGRFSQRLHETSHAEALRELIESIGNRMARHWPPEESNPDELPNVIVRDS
jgi:uncharacterized membrane protein